MRMRIHTRMILTIVVFAALSVTGLLVFAEIYKGRAQELLGNFRDSAARQIRQNVILINSPSVTMAADYSRSDDMVKFIGTRDTMWAVDNVLPALGVFDAEAAWIYDLNHERLFAVCRGAEAAIRDDAALDAVLRNTLPGELFQRFYALGKSGLYELSLAPIQARADSLRTGPHAGQFVVAHALGARFINSLETTFEAKVGLRPPGDSTLLATQAESLFDAGTVRVILPLAGWDGRPVALLVLDINAPMYNEIITGQDRQARHFLLIVAALIAFLTIALLAWVSLPLRKMTAALHSQHPDQIAQLQESSVGFQEISEMVQKCIQQKSELQKEYNERCRTEAVLQESELRSYSIFNNMAEGVTLNEMVFDETGDAVDYIATAINPHFTEVTGLAPDQVLLKSSCEAYNCGAPPFLAEYAAALSEQKPRYFEVYFEPLRRHLGISVIPSSTHTFATIFSDVSGRRHAEQTLVETNRLMLALMSSVPGMVFRCRDDEKRTLEFVSDNCATLTGYAPEDLVENCWVSFADIILPSDLDVVLAELAGAVWESRPYLVTYRIVTAKGDQKWVTERGTIVRRENDGQVILEGIVLDVTEERMREEQRSRLATAVEQVADSVFITDKNGVIEYVNPAFESTHGFSLAEVTGLLPRNALGLIQGNAFYDELTRQLDRGEVWKGRLVVRRKDGKLVEEESTISPVRDALGNIVHIVAVMRDVTEMLALETQLRQAQKLEAVGSLAAGIAHEINTPIQFVGDNLRFISDAFNEIDSLLKRDVAAQEACSAGDSRDALDRFLEEAQSSGISFLREEVPQAIKQSLEGVEHVAKIVRAMKEFAHPEQGQSSAIDINRILQTALTVAHNELKQVAKLKTAFAEDLPPVSGFPSSLNQVFLNLLVNAAHAIQEAGGKNGNGLIVVSTQLSGEHVAISICDNGAGIPQEIIDRIYDPFFTTKEVGKGTGQGLAIARSIIVDKHGGTISCDSRPGAGTTFVVTLPIQVRSAVGV